MDLFELLFIALFLLFPILEQVLRRRKGPDGEPGPDPREREDGEVGPGEVSPRPSSREPVNAADMVPDDLWAVLTGEQRPREGVDTMDEEAPGGGAPWSDEAPRETTPAEPAPAEVPDWEGASTPRPEPRWRLEEEAELAQPGSREYRGPEAYSLETLHHEPVSLESPLEAPAVRHRRFHERVDQPRPVRRARRSALGRALRSPEGLRQAFVLTAVLGTPKSLE